MTNFYFIWINSISERKRLLISQMKTFVIFLCGVLRISFFQLTGQQRLGQFGRSFQFNAQFNPRTLQANSQHLRNLQYSQAERELTYAQTPASVQPQPQTQIQQPSFQTQANPIALGEGSLWQFPVSEQSIPQLQLDQSLSEFTQKGLDQVLAPLELNLQQQQFPSTQLVPTPSQQDQNFANSQLAAEQLEYLTNLEKSNFEDNPNAAAAMAVALAALEHKISPQLPPFMEDASEQSKRQFEAILIDLNTSPSTKQELIENFIATQPENVQKAYASYQAQSQMQKGLYQVSLEAELEKARLIGINGKESNTPVNN